MGLESRERLGKKREGDHPPEQRQRGGILRRMKARDSDVLHLGASPREPFVARSSLFRSCRMEFLPLRPPPNKTRIEPSKPQGGHVGSPTPCWPPSCLLLTRKESPSWSLSPRKANTSSTAGIHHGETEFIRATSG
ncbi:hypothetical protein K0M31_005371 [Melipona bicolor]|uniref:Uncharacterized protein n=1 Tax=Melipona bicolor TaxID=60889 RepID=A0AA40FVG5_9HYME|nr:hypothetical protein K0M31_005371 [Melipona bicolor]